MKGNTGRHATAVLTAWLVVFGGAHIAGGDQGSVSRLPIVGKKMTSGLQIEIDTRWADGPGYRPVRVTLTTLPPAPAPADRTIRVEIHPNQWSSGYGSTQTSEFVEIPQGSVSATTTILVPRSYTWSSLSVACFEDGVPLQDLTENLGIPYAGNDAWDDMTPLLLFIDEQAPLFSQRPSSTTAWSPAEQTRLGKSHDLPDIRRLALMFPRQNGVSSININNPASDFESLAAMFECPNMEFLSFAELPDRWLAYSTIDIAFVEFNELQRLQKTHPKKWAVLREWLTAGGTLAVYNTGPNFKNLRKLESSLELPDNRRANESGHLAGWNPADPSKWSESVQDFPTFYQINQAPVPPMSTVPGATSPAATSSANDAANKEAERKRPKEIPFVWRECGVGRVVAIDAEDPFAKNGGEFWGWLLNDLGQPQWLWHLRHGVSLINPNSEFWNFLIPGVGRAPIGAFLLLISLFMVAIGPVNYYVLRRHGRLVLLLLTVPAGASIVTLSLILYGVVADGLGVRVRARSFTAIDQRREQAVSWSRQSYYAGVAPSRGLSFPKDTAAYPLEHIPPTQWERRRGRRLEWTDDAQVLASGFMGSRTSSQLMVTRACASNSRIAMEENNEKGTPPRAENRLGSTLQKVLVCDAHGDLYWGEDTKENTTISLSAIKESEARKRLSKELTDNEPRFPDGYDVSYFQTTQNWRQSRRYYRPGGVVTSPTQTSSILDTNLTRIGQLSTPLAKRSYCAIVSKSREVPLGTHAREEASFHVIQGRW